MVQQQGFRWGVVPPEKIFSEKISKGYQGKIYPRSPRHFKKFKIKPQRGNQRIFFGLKSKMFHLVPPLRFRQNFGKNL